LVLIIFELEIQDFRGLLRATIESKEIFFGGRRDLTKIRVIGIVHRVLDEPSCSFFRLTP
jgi:hypothetical protein